ncbi:hypothetical protein TSAR_006524 [Trichomalopsis sarcophagae]|uniref:Uncharacterized protein n=1 Tax=Trichomalopsis sarcophagae TaxID=543379 RepID=A0A232EKE3_9HYME|nr:hypothetical protein TSAR_006524 [Trichomalopsis sarcophagae]
MDPIDRGCLAVIRFGEFSLLICGRVDSDEENGKAVVRHLSSLADEFKGWDKSLRTNQLTLLDYFRLLSESLLGIPIEDRESSPGGRKEKEISYTQSSVLRCGIPALGKRCLKRAELHGVKFQNYRLRKKSLAFVLFAKIPSTRRGTESLQWQLDPTVLLMKKKRTFPPKPDLEMTS